MSCKILLSLAVLLIAARADAPAPQNVVLDQQEQTVRALLDAEMHSINLQYENLRTSACWKRGLKPEECGRWLDEKTIQRIAAEVKEK